MIDVKRSATRETWFVVADGRHARLFKATRARAGHLCLEQADSIEHQWEGHEHGRPTFMRSGQALNYAGQSHEREEDLHRFARRLVPWLDTVVHERRIDRLSVFMSARALGVIRELLDARIGRHLDLHEANLASLPQDALMHHDSIRQLVGGLPAS